MISRTKIIATLGIVTLFLNVQSIQSEANNSLLNPPLSTMEENLSFSGMLDNESIEKMMELTEKNNSEISLDNIKPRMLVEKLDIISGQTKKAGQTIWITLINDEGKILPLGNTITNRNGDFSFLNSNTIDNLNGEIFLVLSLVSDLRLAIPLEEKTKVVPFYQAGKNQFIEGETAQELTIIIEKTEFFENERPLEFIESNRLEIYKENTFEPLTIKLTGQIFGNDLENLQMFSVTLPGLLQREHAFSLQEPHKFSAKINYADLKWNEDIQIILMATESRENIISPSPSTRSTHQIISFRLHPSAEFPTFLTSTLESNFNGLTLALFGLLLFSIILIIKTHHLQSSWAKTIGVIIIFSELILFSYVILSNTVVSLFEKGLLQVPGQEMTILRNSNDEISQPTLVKLDENLQPSPSLSTGWSKISPHIWEFVLRKNISSESVIHQFRKKIQSGSPDRQYLASVKNIISVNPDKLQIITQFPDPLLPQKLTKVYLDRQIDANSSTQMFLPIEKYANRSRLEKNEDFFMMPFLNETPKYQTIIKIQNQDSAKQLIKSQKIDFIDEPETKLWPTILQNNFRIVPKINTESIMLMTDRKSFFLKEADIMLALRKILNSTRILQTSYFQYGQLANQFVPPGVVGYDTSMTMPEDPRPAAEILEAAKNKLGVSEIILTFKYPSKEKTVARVLQQELEIAGVTVIPTEVSNEDFEKNLLKRASDITLMPLQFDLGDAGPFLDALIDSGSPFNRTYSNPEVDELISQTRTELNRVKRIKNLQKIMKIIVMEDPAGIPLLFKKSFVAIKNPVETTWWEKWMQGKVLGWR